MDNRLALIMRDIAVHSGGKSDFDLLIDKIQKAAKKGKTCIIEKEYNNTSLLRSKFDTYKLLYLRLKSNKDAYMQKYYEESFEDAKTDIPEKYVKLLAEGFKVSAGEFCMPFFGKSYYKVIISW